MKYKVGDDIVNTRIDKLVEMNLKDLGFTQVTRSMIKEYISDGVLVNNTNIKPSYKVRQGDEYEIDEKYWEKFFKEIDLSEEIIPQPFDLEIIHEDSDIIILYKPKGVVVHPGVGNKKDTLANYIRFYLESKNEYDTNLDRCGIVHRLDKGVSGIMVVAKNKTSQENLKRQFSQHTVEKIYRAQVEKYKNTKYDSIDFSDWSEISGYIGRDRTNRYKMAFREYEFNGSKGAKSYIMKESENTFLVRIITGRMHQIRATLNYMGYSIVGDSLYGSSSKDDESVDIMLESIYLSFDHPTNGERMEFKR